MCDTAKEINIVGLGHVASGKNSFMVGLAYYLGLEQFGPLVSRDGSSTHTKSAYAKGKEDSYHARLAVVHDERKELRFEGRHAGSHKIDTLRMYFQYQDSIRAINFLVQGGHTSTKKISQDPNFKVDGVLYLANQWVFDHLRSDPYFERIIGESFDDVVDSLNQDKESALRYISQGIPVKQIVVIEDDGVFINYDHIEPVNNQLLVMPEFEPIWQYGKGINSHCRGDYMERVFSIFDGFLRNDLGLAGKLISVAKRENTLHYKEVIQQARA